MIRRFLSTRLPTRFGEFRLYAYKDEEHNSVHLALVKGDVQLMSPVLVRIHSECLTGEVFGSIRCDCGEQLDAALRIIQREQSGILIYLRQEGRGIGLLNKLQAYRLQDEGLDTVEANLKLGFDSDHREYSAAVFILEDLTVSSVRLLTNNPKKLSDIDGSNIELVERVPLQTEPNHENLQYLRTKRDRLGHILDITDIASSPSEKRWPNPGTSRLSSNLTNSCWDSLLQLTERMRHWKGPVKYCVISFGTTTSININGLLQSGKADYKVLFVFDPDDTPVSDDYACYQLHGLSGVEELAPGNLPEHIREFLKLYVPYCFLSAHARRWQRSVAVTHFAQSLDSRIATTSGDSKWIGNESNLVHAHRMRALCDGVLIGSGTLKRDQPRLTVRRVSGPNPVRILLGSSVDNVDSLLEASEDLILILGNNQLSQNHQVRRVAVDNMNDHMATFDILERLYRERIYSVYIEGGAVTTSHFLKENTIDIMQLHIAPRILGSGVNAFSLPPIETIGESIRFVRHTLVSQGDTIMFVGEVDNSRQVVANE